jgi:hypothetical protein
MARTSARHSLVDAARGGPAANVSLPRVDDNGGAVWSSEGIC